jgi:serine-type D-Ala-D-Ala carboxypeptidase (penicillin-binding protein 5/6)
VHWGLHRKLLVVSVIICGLLFQSFTVNDVYADEVESPLTARNAVVVHAESGQVLFDQGMDEQVAPASLTKIFTALVALETAPIERDMQVDEYDLVGEASIGLVADETVSLETLLHGLMLTSGNDAAMTISRELGYLPGDTPQESVSRFIDRVNATAYRLGLENTNLRNPHGLDQQDHYSTASDIAAMTMYAIENPVFQEIIATPYYAFNGREFYNVNRFLDVYPGLIGGKTGITTKAGHSLVQVAEREGDTIVAVLLGSTADDWYLDAEYLLDLGFRALAENRNDETRPIIGRSSLDVPKIDDGASVGGNLTVDRVNEHEAIIRATTPVGDQESSTWRWFLVSIGTMGVALVMVLHYPAIIGMGALALHRGSRIRFPIPSMRSVRSIPGWLPVNGMFKRRGRRRPERPAAIWQAHLSDETPVDRLRSGPRFTRDMPTRQSDDEQGSATVSTSMLGQDVTYSPARTRAEQAIKLAMQGRYHLATEEFRLALDRDPNVDLTKCPGFWRMQPMGYIAAAKAYALNDQGDDARRLLTVVQLGFKQNPDLVSLFGRAIKELQRR